MMNVPRICRPGVDANANVDEHSEQLFLLGRTTSFLEPRDRERPWLGIRLSMHSCESEGVMEWLLVDEEITRKGDGREERRDEIRPGITRGSGTEKESE